MSNEDKIICTCANVSESKIDDYFKKNNNYISSFDKFLNDTKAGTYCTACRLDLETIFISKNLSEPKFININYDKGKSIKRKIYDTVDNIFPKITLKNQNYFPILNFKNKTFRQEIWITNMEILSEKLKREINIDDIQVFIYLFNHSGKKVWETSDIVKVNKRVIFKIPSELIDNNQDISVGHIQVERKFKVNCSKGTTRPQIMVYSNNSHCAVHGQDIQLTNGSTHSSIFRPNIDTQILSFINPSTKSLEINLGAPRAIDDENYLKNYESLKIKIPPNGSKVHIINYDKRFKYLENKYFSIDWKGVGKYKSHVYCVSKNLRFISLDHI